MRDNDSYYYDRAETELELAQRATHPSAVRAHYIIANHYLDRCYGGADGAAQEAGQVNGQDAGHADAPAAPAAGDRDEAGAPDRDHRS